MGLLELFATTRVRQVMAATAVAGMVAVLLVAGAPTAVALDPFDPDLFGPGESWPRSDLYLGDTGPYVAELQEALAAGGFRPGPADGRFGRATLGAVYAFQKVHGLPVDGVFRTGHWDLFEEDIELAPTAAEPHRIEVDLARQVLFLVEDDEVAAVLPVSSGNGETYRNYAGRVVRANTPEGRFSFYRQYEGWRISYLGALYRPYYFRGGYAIHGSPSVPAYPASHGCVRVHLWDMDWLREQVGLGLPVYVYGRAAERSDLIETLPAPGPRPVRVEPPLYV